MRIEPSINLYPTGLLWYYPTIEVLIVDDNATDLEWVGSMAREVAGSSFVHTSMEPERLPDLLRYYSPKVVLISQRLGEDDGTSLIEQHQLNYPNTAFVLLWDPKVDESLSSTLSNAVSGVMHKGSITTQNLYSVLLRSCRDRFNRELPTQQFDSVGQDT